MVNALLRAMLFPTRIFQKKQPQNNFEAFKEKGGRYDIDLENYLKKFLSLEGEKERINFRSYSVHLFYIKMKREDNWKIGHLVLNRNTWNDSLLLYFDAEYSFILFKGKKPLCAIAFDKASDSGSIITIRQIQGVKRREKDLGFFRWEKMLYRIVID